MTRRPDEVRKENVDDLAQAYRRIEHKDVSSALGITKNRVQRLLSELGYRRIRGRLVPRMPPEVTKQNRVDNYFLVTTEKNEKFSNIIITGDES